MNKSFFILIFSAVFIISCEKPLTMEDLIKSYGDSGNSGNSGDSGDTGDTGDVCSDNNKFCHSHDGLNWSDKSLKTMSWASAETYCEDMGGRLPTISELRTLIQNCSGMETDGACGIFDNCLSWDDCWNNSCLGCSDEGDGRYSFFGDTGYFRSSSERSDGYDGSWYISFSYGGLDSSYYENRVYNVRCVK